MHIRSSIPLLVIVTDGLQVMDDHLYATCHKHINLITLLCIFVIKKYNNLKKNRRGVWARKCKNTRTREVVDVTMVW